MSSQNNFYITTTLPYVNADPHIGFALELVQADVIARYHRDILNQPTFFNTGTDEHGQKIYQKALEVGKDPQSYCDEYAAKFKQLVPALGINPDIHFIRTTDAHHIAACQKFWQRCEKNGDIYKAKYKIKYCVGCELEKTESDLSDAGRCLLHPNLEIEIIEEENYFFRFSRYQKPLLEFYDQHPDFVVPDFRFNEIKQFVKRGLQDFSISRLKSKMPWGVPVPEDDEHVMYVWFDALINYISTLGWPGEVNQLVSKSANQFNEFWPGIQIAGKDNLRQQSCMWQAMLMSAGLPNSKQIIIHGFINSAGQKMSKSLGNVADPYAILDQLKSKGLTQEQAIDALRYYLTREISTFEDSDYTWEKLVESYNANLANGIGNLTSRILKMAANAKVSINPDILSLEQGLLQTYRDLFDQYELRTAADAVWILIDELDGHIQKTEPFKLIKTDEEKAKKEILFLLGHLWQIAMLVRPFLPQTSEKILQALKNPKLENIPRLFPRIEK